MKQEYPTREQLIAICERAIVPQEKWNDRDSESAQKNVGRVWQLLKCGCEFLILTKDNCTAYQPSDDETWQIHFWVHNFMWFENGGIDDADNPKKGYLSDSNGQPLFFYLPTEETLKRANGNDWYNL
jgi:hypothetical protein